MLNPVAVLAIRQGRQLPTQTYVLPTQSKFFEQIKLFVKLFTVHFPAAILPLPTLNFGLPTLIPDPRTATVHNEQQIIRWSNSISMFNELL